MPIYEYQCEACGNRLEVMQKMSDAPLTECPGCGRHSLRKLVSAAGFQLKGGGWYATDFKDGAKKKTKDGEPASSGGSSSETTKVSDTAKTGDDKQD